MPLNSRAVTKQFNIIPNLFIYFIGKSFVLFFNTIQVHDGHSLVLKSMKRLFYFIESQSFW
jgi:hypothetical protein